MRTEISQAKKDANLYKEAVEKGKSFEAMKQRKRKRNQVRMKLQCIVWIYLCLFSLFYKLHLKWPKKNSSSFQTAMQFMP